MRRSLALSGGADTDETCFLAQLGQVGRAQVAHPGLYAANQLRQHLVHRAADFLQRLHPFGGDFASRIGRVTIARGGPGLHCREAAHATVLLVELATNLHDFAGRLRAAGEDTAANDRLGQRERLNDVPRLVDAAVRQKRDAPFLRSPRGNIQCRKLGNAHARHDARRANRARALADLHRIRAALGEEIHPCGAGHVAGNDRQLGKGVAQHSHRVAHAAAMAVGRRDRHRIQPALHQPADVRENPLAIQLSERVPCRRHRRPADQPVMRVARRLELRFPLLRDPFHVAHRDQPLQPVLIVHHQQLVNARMRREELVRLGDGIAAQFLFIQRMDLAARRERLGHLACGVALLDHMARQQAHQLALAVHHGKRAERKSLLRNQLQHLLDQLLGGHFDRLLDQSVDVVLHAADFGKLLPIGHVVMDQPQSAVERHRDCHPRLGHRVHIRRDDRDVQVQSLRQDRVELRVPGQDLGVERRERDVVVRQPQAAEGREEGVRRLVKLGIERVGLFMRCHVF